jgi:hypothetical protein
VILFAGFSIVIPGAVNKHPPLFILHGVRYLDQQPAYIFKPVIEPALAGKIRKPPGGTFYRRNRFLGIHNINNKKDSGLVFIYNNPAVVSIDY